MTTPEIGDTWPVDYNAPADCPATREHLAQFLMACVRDEGHQPPHVAVDQDHKVISVWKS